MGGSPALAVPQTESAVDTLHVDPFFCKKNTVEPGFTLAAAHSVPSTVAQLNLIIVAPWGRAAKIDASVHVAPDVEPEPVGLAVEFVGVALPDGDGDELEEQPATVSSVSPAAAVSTAVW